MPEGTQHEKRPPRLTFERALLLGILALQAAILCCVLRRPAEALRLSATSGPVTSPCEAGAPGPQATDGACREVRVTLDPRLVDPRRLALRDMVALHSHMQQRLEKTFTDLERIGSLVNLDEGWELLPSSPALDMREAEDAYIVVFSLPGVDESQVAVTLEDRLLTLLAPLRSPPPAPGRLRVYERRVQMPGPVAEGRPPEAGLSNGLLRVVVPKGAQGAGPTGPGRRLRLM